MDWVRVENILFVQDFEQGDTDSRFKTDLVGLLADMTVPPQVIERVSKFDFRSAAGQLVISKPGLLHDYGLDRMHDILQSYNTDLSQADLVYQTSSLGKLDSKWIQELSSLMRGQKHETKNVTVLFPSVQTVLDSVNPLDGMNMFFDGVLDDFGNSIVKDCKSRSNCLMHSKIGICALGGIGEHVHLLGEGECIGYLYCGSHNATASAWGRRQGKKLRFWNWELGIVLKVTRQGGTRFQIPFVYPAASFTPQNGPFSAEMKRLYFA
jgi:tyrosyl-DNA phosphodiesterase-1